MEYKEKESIAIKMYRIERWFYTHKLKIFAKIFYHLIQILLGCTIPYSTILEKGVNIAHFHGIVLHQKCKIGSGTIIYQNVCVGGRNGKGRSNNRQRLCFRCRMLHLGRNKYRK